MYGKWPVFGVRSSPPSLSVSWKEWASKPLPTILPTPSLDGLPVESDRVYELFLSRDHFVEVFIRIQIERGLNPRVPQDSLHRLRVLFSLVDKPIRQAVA